MKEPNQSLNGISRRNFMKKTALTVGAVSVLSQGVGLASFDFTSLCPHPEYFQELIDSYEGRENGATVLFERYKCGLCGKTYQKKTPIGGGYG